MKANSVSPAGTQQQSDARSAAMLKISIIVPVLDEGDRTRKFIDDVRKRAPSAELIVVRAAGSRNVSSSVAEICDQVLTAPRGRASQMNTGAEAARGDVFWFVHADCEVPERCVEQIARTLQDREVVGGCFRIRFPRREMIYRVSDAGGNLAVELFGRCYGDHGIFCRRRDFFAVGGYTDVPILEDAEFYRRLRHRGRTEQLRSKIVTSPRRYEEVGPYRLTASYLLLSALYLLRVPIRVLARIYNRLCLCPDERATPIIERQ